MILLSHDNNGSVLPPDSVVLVAHADGSLQLIIPADPELDLYSRAQILLSAVALRSTDDDWVKEQVDFIIEVDRQLEERSSETNRLN